MLPFKDDKPFPSDHLQNETALLAIPSPHPALRPFHFPSSTEIDPLSYALSTQSLSNIAKAIRAKHKIHLSLNNIFGSALLVGLYLFDVCRSTVVAYSLN